MFVLLTGPPGCGKDTLANKLVKDYGFKHLMFKEPLYALTATYLGIDESKMRELMERPYKDEMLIHGRTPRFWMIYVAETIYKKDNPYYFAELLAHSIKKTDGNIVVSDLGFKEELEVMRNLANEYDTDYYLVKLKKDPKFRLIFDNRGITSDKMISPAHLFMIVS